MLGLGIVGGSLNGFCVAYLGFPAFITTLATMWFFRGLAYVYTEGQAVTGLPRDFRLIALGDTFGISNDYHNSSARGGLFPSHPDIAWPAHLRSWRQQEAARLSGVTIKSTKVFVFVVSGFRSARWRRLQFTSVFRTACRRYYV